MSDPRPHYVIVGSGPAALGAALAFEHRSCTVTVLDVGIGLEPDRENVRLRLAASGPEEWRSEDLAFLHSAGRAGESPAMKHLFGSDVAFRGDGHLNLEPDASVGATFSNAYGGLSNVWGAGICPYTAEDLTGWPISEPELAAHARSVLEHLPYSGTHDELESIYPILREPDGLLHQSSVARHVGVRAREHQQRLRARGFTIGAARLAVRTGEPAPANGCVYCRHCLDGCPYDHIYSSRYGIESLRLSGRINYFAGHHVHRITETTDGVEIKGVEVASSAPFQVHGDRVFLAAGALGSTAILQQSKLIATSVELLDSQTLYVPMLYIGTRADDDEKAYTLAELFCILDDDSTASRPIHTSLYTYDEDIIERARRYHPRLTRLVRPLIDAFAPRLVVGIAFLHSKDSGRFSARLIEGPTSRLQLTGHTNPMTRQVVHRFERALLRSLPRIGLVPLLGLSQLATIGGGFHFGGSVPMSAHPQHGQSDVLGRPWPTQRVHVVDGASFPTIPAGTITLPIMANAHRIAAAAFDLDQSA